MPTYQVERRTTRREVYYVDAANKEDAVKNWDTGELFVSEVTGSEPYSVRLAG